MARVRCPLALCALPLFAADFDPRDFGAKGDGVTGTLVMKGGTAYGFVAEGADGSRLTEKEARTISVNVFEKVVHVFWFGDGWTVHVRFRRKEGVWQADKSDCSPPDRSVRIVTVAR